ncbi:MAG: phosphoribosylamine--glycine ligase [Candidatus Cloacimonetes bacterium]|nr:phosphoribosylamine--glycine ligase [Candidatus Cloacimonadota bacterium]
MKVLVVGSGAREHAIAESFKKSKKVQEVIVTPGNDGIALYFRIAKLPDFTSYIDFVKKEKIDLVFIGPEQPLSEGLTDYLEQHGIKVIGPSQLAARIESSKAFAKKLMQKYKIPTAAFKTFTDYEKAEKYLASCTFPQVIKADGLAAGKGVIIVHNISEARETLQNIMIEGAFGNAGNQVVIEEFMIGWETSIFAFSDGKSFVSTIFAQDHKAIYDGDKGPNTGGMGAYAPVDKAKSYKHFVDEKIFKPVFKAMQEEGFPFKGVLFAGLMITKRGPNVVEFNCRFGDPETQVILPLLKTDLADICQSILDGTIEDLSLEWEDGYAVNVVAASQGYPGEYRKGDLIEIAPELLETQDAKIYFSGVKKSEKGMLTNGGRVCSVMAKSTSLTSAINSAYNHFLLLKFNGKTYRTDIGKKGLY